MTRATVALTGGTGFIGRACAAALASAGWHVRMLVRRDPTHPSLANTPIELVLGDLEDETALVHLVQGADAVVHAAGTIRGRDARAFLPINRDATAHLAEIAAREAPRSRFILLSSQAARRPELSPYAASKCAGEEAVKMALGSTQWVILRPGVVYGPGDEATRSLLRLASLPVVLVPAAPEPRLSMIHVADVAAAVVAFCAPGPSAILHELSDAALDGHGWRDIVSAASQDAKPRFVTIPDSFLLAAGHAADGWSALSRTPALFGAGKAREILYRDWRPDQTLRPSPLLWQPGVELAVGLHASRGQERSIPDTE